MLDDNGEILPYHNKILKLPQHKFKEDIYQLNSEKIITNNKEEI
jgi:hypothetical protein